MSASLSPLPASRDRSQRPALRTFRATVRLGGIQQSLTTQAVPHDSWWRWLPSMTLLVAIIGLLAYGPIGQPEGYHQFADQRMFWGTPHAADVWSSLGFALVGLWGVLKLFPLRRHEMLRDGWPGYLLFLLALIGTAAGSSYYHLAPDNWRLLFDRLPIALACAGLLAAVGCETHQSKAGWAAAAMLGIIAIMSVAWWHISGLLGKEDLRLYLLLQGLPLFLIPLWQKNYGMPSADRWAFGAAIGCYALAKAAELADGAIFSELTALSGHTLKHLLATLGAAVIVGRLIQRVGK